MSFSSMSKCSFLIWNGISIGNRQIQNEPNLFTEQVIYKPFTLPPTSKHGILLAQ